jgi:serine/threonine-protein kinase ULK4
MLLLQPEHMSLFPGAFLRHLMPALCSVIVSSSSSGLSDTRFFCLRIMSDCLALYLTSPDVQGVGPAAAAGADMGWSEQQQESPAEALDVLLRCHVVPLVPVLLELEDPMPLYALKLLGGILDVNSSYVSVVDELGLSQCFFDFLTLDHPNNNVHNIRLCRQLALSGCISTQQLLQLRAADKVGGWGIGGE